MFLSDISIKRPVLATVMNLVLVVLGIAGAVMLQVRQYPDVDPPVVSISTYYRGAPAEVVDADVTQRIIDELTGIEGVRIVDARSADERSSIDIEFAVGRDLDLAAADVRDRLQRVQNQLPDPVDDPVVSKASADSSPIMWIALTSDTMTRLEMTDYADRVMLPRLENLPGVAEVRIGGEQRYAVRIWLNPDAMAARGVTANDIADRLSAENVEVPSGRIESKGREFSVRTLSRLTQVDDFRNLVVRDAGEEGNQTGRVLLGDVADVELGAEEYRRYFRANGKEAIALGIIRQSDANTLDVADAVKHELANLAPTLPPELGVQVTTDDSVFIEASIHEVLIALGIAVGLVVLVIWLFLGSLRATIVPTVAIPVSIIAPLFVLYLCGFSINVLTLLAAVLAIGLVVDDAIVVLENIERRVREGEPPLVAAIRGARQVGFAVVATTVVLAAVFVPLSFLTGKVGRLFTEFGVTMAVAVIISGFVALTWAAMLSSRLLKPHKPHAPRRSALGRAWAGIGAGFRRAGAAAMNGYERLVRGAIALRWVMVLLMAAVFGLGYVLFRAVPGELTPTEDQGRFFINVEGPEGASIEYTLEQVKQVEQILLSTPVVREALGPIITIVPSFGGNNATNSGRLVPRLKPWHDRETSQQEVVRTLFPLLREGVPGARAFPINPPGLGIRGANQPVNFVISAPDFDVARDASQAVLDEAEETGLFVNLQTDYDPTKPQFRISVDRDRAADLGIAVEDLGEAMQAFLGGREVGDFYDRGELYDVILQARRDDRGDPADLTNIYVRSQGGQLIPMSSVVTLDERGATRELRRIDRLPSVVLTGSLAPGVALGEALEKLEEIAGRKLPIEGRVNYLGESREFKETSSQLYVTFGLALLLVFLVLAAQFESWVHPITIMVAVPLAVVGGLITLYVMGLTLNIYSQIGMILLIGLTAKNGILLVEFANQLREEDPQKTPRDAAIEAARLRLRPILMTSIATILGAIPLVISSGAGAEGRQAIGAVVAGGMLFSTVLTLVVIPAIYTLMARLTKAANATELKLNELMGPETPTAAPARPATA